MTDAPSWDPLAALPEGEPAASFGGRWENRLWLNVPGPFYTGETDTCWTGRLVAPRHVLYGGEHLTEYVYRQPATAAEVRALCEAAWSDPFAAYACDGDLHWTPAAVREWWRGRGRVTAHLAESSRLWSTSARPDEREAADGVRDFTAYIADGLAMDLRRYLFRLQEGRYPASSETLPPL